MAEQRHRPALRRRRASVLGLLSSILLALFAGEVAAQPTYGYEVLNAYPHDAAAFTEGLVYTGETLYESTGLYGASTVRQVDLRSGTVVRERQLAAQYFGEGATIFQGKIFQLTWQTQTAFVYDAGTFAPLGQFFYAGEGWGLTHDDHDLIMSDGTDRIRFLDPATFQTIKTISVRDQQGTPLANINELEYINGAIYANVWLTDIVARIDPISGAVVGWIDFTGLLSAGTSADVLNGIAFDPATGHLLVTGKLWPTLFEVRITDRAVVSIDGTVVPTAPEVIDNDGAAWTIGSGGVILRNGKQASGGYGSQIYWKNNTVYVLSGVTWWQWTGSGWLNVGSATPGTWSPTSSDATTVPAATQIVDDQGSVWTIGGNQTILRNGTLAAGGYGSKIYWKDRHIYVLSDVTWWAWTGSGWMNIGSDMPGSTLSPSSPDGITSPPATQIADNDGVVWTIGSGGVVLRNGVQAAGGYGSIIYWRNATIYVLSDVTWWKWTGAGWLNVGTRQP